MQDYLSSQTRFFSGVTLSIKPHADKLLMNPSCRPSCVTSIAGGEMRMVSHVLWDSGYQMNISMFISLHFSGLFVISEPWQQKFDKRAKFKSQTKKALSFLACQLICADLSASGINPCLWVYSFVHTS